jgi:hypothetical protein
MRPLFHPSVEEITVESAVLNHLRFDTVHVRVVVVKPDDLPKQQLSSSAPEPPAVVTQPPRPVQAPAVTVSVHNNPTTEPPAVAAENKDLSGNWQGEYTHRETITKVKLHLSQDPMDVMTGTLTFDAGGYSASSCSLTGNYNPRTRFMVLIVGTCQGTPPNYLQGRIGFSSVNPADHQLLGVDQMHDGLLGISR